MLNFITVDDVRNWTSVTMPILMTDDIDLILQVTAKRIEEARSGITDTVFPIIESLGNMSKSVVLGRGRTVMYILYEWNDDTVDQYLVPKYYIGEINITNVDGNAHDNLQNISTQKVTGLERLCSSVDEQSIQSVVWMMRNLNKLTDSSEKDEDGKKE